MRILRKGLLMLLFLSIPCFADSSSAFAQASSLGCFPVTSTGASLAVADLGICMLGGEVLTSYTHASATVSGHEFTGDTSSLGDESSATAEGIFDFTVNTDGSAPTAEVDVFGDTAAQLGIHASSRFSASLQMGLLPPETQTLIDYPPVTLDNFPCCTDASGHASFFLTGLTPGVPAHVQLIFDLTSEINESTQNVHATGTYFVTLVPEPSTLLLLAATAGRASLMSRSRSKA
jgi:hypothetical protein